MDVLWSSIDLALKLVVVEKLPGRHQRFDLVSSVFLTPLGMFCISLSMSAWGLQWAHALNQPMAVW